MYSRTPCSPSHKAIQVGFKALDDSSLVGEEKRKSGKGKNRAWREPQMILEWYTTNNKCVSRLPYHIVYCIPCGVAGI